MKKQIYDNEEYEAENYGDGSPTIVYGCVAITIAVSIAVAVIYEFAK